MATSEVLSFVILRYFHIHNNSINQTISERLVIVYIFSGIFKMLKNGSQSIPSTVFKNVIFEIISNYAQRIVKYCMKYCTRFLDITVRSHDD